MASKDIVVPDLGNFKDVSVIDVLVKAGDAVQVDTPLLTLETEKATMDVPSSAAGVIEKLTVNKGSTVSAGDVIGTLRTEGADAPAAKPETTAASAPAKSAAGSAPAPAPAAARATAAASDMVVPDIGNFKDVAVIDVLVKVGDSVQVDTPLLTLETEKATMDVPATAAGVVESLRIKKGSTVSAGDVIGTLRGSGGTAAAKTAAVPAPAATAVPAQTSAAATPSPAVKPPAVPAALAMAAPPKVNEEGFARAHASPVVRRFARELGVDLARVKGSGHKGRVTEEDVKLFVKAAMSSGAPAASSSGGGLPKISVPDFAQFGAVEIKPLGRIQKISGPRLHASWVNLPHVTQFDEADITELEELRKSLKSKAEAAGVRLTALAFIVRACVKALQEYPLFNSSLDASGENLVYKKYVHLGFAADTRQGLLVPVIRDADRKDIYQIARALAELSEKARTGKLSGAEMQGGCFTVSSLGGIGGTAFTPIINAPEVAILGVSRSTTQPVWMDNAFVPRLMLPTSLSYDHRVIDGANGARFSTYLIKLLADPRSLLEAVP